MPSRPAPPHLPEPLPAGAAGGDGRPFFKLVLLVNLIARPFARLHEREHGIGLAEWRVLRAVAAGAPALSTAGQVGEALGMDKMAVSRAVRALEAKGRLSRAPDPADRRRHALRVTAAGRALVAAIEPSGRAREAALLAALSPAEQAAFAQVLDRLLARARSLPDGGTDQKP
jgi:DNA-binding MarR family transcriptional regulator